jgi:glycerophosphoryl diester phosphodiesterase
MNHWIHRPRLSSLLRLFAVVAAVIPMLGVQAGAVEIIAHRGKSHAAPENTLASVNLAWEHGADAVEVDVRLSRDGEIVLMHDMTTRRTAGHNRRVAHQTLEELRTLDAGSWKGPEWAGERIPTLAEVLATVPDDKRLFIDLKVGREVIPELKRVLDDSGVDPEQTVIIGRSLATLEAVKQALPDSPVYWIVIVRQHPQTGEWLPGVESLVRRAEALANVASTGLNDATLALVRSAGVRNGSRSFGNRVKRRSRSVAAGGTGREQVDDRANRVLHREGGKEQQEVDRGIGAAGEGGAVV